jgi:hypothetical protein
VKNPQKLTKNSGDLPDSEICEIMTNILNIPRQEVEKNIRLFKKTNHYILNCLYYLSQMESDQDKITAVHSLEFVYNFNKGVDKYLSGNKLSKFSAENRIK